MIRCRVRNKGRNKFLFFAKNVENFPECGKLVKLRRVPAWQAVTTAALCAGSAVK